VRGVPINFKQDERIIVMVLKQVSATDDSSVLIDDIAGHFQAMNLPRLAKANLYLGMPLSILKNISQALFDQRYEDENKKFNNRLRYAGIVRERNAETFMWDKDTYPFAEPGAIEAALSIDFVKQRKNLIVAGPPGTGKSMLVVIIACKAIRDGFSVKYKTAHDIAVDLKEMRTGNSLSSYIKKLKACDVLIIEDVKFASFNTSTAESFFSVINGRYECKTTIITSNGNINEWAAKFPDKTMSSAMLGRFYQEAILVNMNGAEDMRLKHAKGLLNLTSTDGIMRGGG